MFTKRVPWLLPWPARTLMVTFPLVILRMLKPTVGIMSSLNCPDWKGESELGKGPKWQVPMGGPLWPRPGSGEPLLPPPHPSSPSRPGGGPRRVPNPPPTPAFRQNGALTKPSIHLAVGLSCDKEGSGSGSACMEIVRPEVPPPRPAPSPFILWWSRWGKQSRFTLAQGSERSCQIRVGTSATPHMQCTASHFWASLYCTHL